MGSTEPQGKPICMWHMDTTCQAWQERGKTHSKSVDDAWDVSWKLVLVGQDKSVSTQYSGRIHVHHHGKSLVGVCLEAQRGVHPPFNQIWQLGNEIVFRLAVRYCRGTSKCLQSCWGLEKLVLVSWKCHAVAWHHGLYEIWRQACQWFGFALRLCSWSCMLAPGKSMQADLHAARFPHVLIIYSLPVVFVCNALFLFLLLCFHMYKPQTNLVNVCAHFIEEWALFWWHLRCAVFSYVQTSGILWKHLCAAQFCWRNPCHDHSFDLLCFHMYKPQSNLNSRQRRKSTVAARNKEINWTFL